MSGDVLLIRLFRQLLGLLLLLLLLLLLQATNCISLSLFCIDNGTELIDGEEVFDFRIRRAGWCHLRSVCSDRLKTGEWRRLYVGLSDY